MVLQILLVEDNPAQVYLVQHSLARWKTPFKLRVASSAEEALDFVNRRNGHNNAPQPHLTLLDLHLPNQPGFVVLDAIKNAPRTSWHCGRSDVHFPVEIRRAEDRRFSR